MKNHKELAEEYLRNMDNQIKSINSGSDGEVQFKRKTTLASIYAQAAMAHASIKDCDD